MKVSIGNERIEKYINLRIIKPPKNMIERDSYFHSFLILKDLLLVSTL